MGLMGPSHSQGKPLGGQYFEQRPHIWGKRAKDGGNNRIQGPGAET